MRFREFLESLYKEDANFGGKQYSTNIQKIIDHQEDVFKNYNVIVKTSAEIPSTENIPKEDRGKTTKWIRIDDVSCCFIDMVGSTKMSTSLHPNSTAQIYRYFTGTVIKILKAFEAPYIDVKGDGVFALFDKGQEHAALAAVVTCKTFINEKFSKDVKLKRSLELDGHYGISRGTLLVRRIGSRRTDDSDQARNEVWAGRPVNQAAKLAGLAGSNKLLVSNRYHQCLKLEEALKSCGCSGGEYIGKKSELWTKRDLSDEDHLKIETGWELASNWCSIHGEKSCKEMLLNDQ